MQRKLLLTVKANAKENRVIPVGENQYRVLVKAPPAEGRANEAVIRALSDFLNLPKSRLTLQSGHKSKNKVIIVHL